MDPNETMRRFDAKADWNRARRKALYQQVSCFFRECQVDLVSFEDVRKGLHLTQKIDRGVQEIPVDRNPRQCGAVRRLHVRRFYRAKAICNPGGRASIWRCWPARRRLSTCIR